MTTVATEFAPVTAGDGFHGTADGWFGKTGGSATGSLRVEFERRVTLECQERPFSMKNAFSLLKQTCSTRTDKSLLPAPEGRANMTFGDGVHRGHPG